MGKLRGFCWVGGMALALALLPVEGGGGSKGLTPTPSPRAEETSFIVLCYHRFIARPETLKGPGSPYRLSLTEFRRELQYLKDHGITPISFDQLKAFWFEGKALPPRPVLLTFDDGFKSIYEKAYPVMKEFGYPGLLFLYTDFIRGQGDSMKFSDIEALKKDGWALESHTKSHMNLGVEGEKQERQAFRELLKREMTDPLDFIRERFESQTEALAYPYGVFNEEVLNQTKEAGYKMAFTVNPGPNDKQVPPFKLRRNMILSPVRSEAFAKIFEEKVLHLGKFFPGDGDFIVNNRPILRAEIKDDIVPRSIRFSLGEHNMAFKYDPQTRVLEHRMGADLKPGGHMVILSARDAQGQLRTYSWYFRVQHRNWKKTAQTDGKK